MKLESSVKRVGIALGIVAAVIIWCAPAQAVTFTFQDEYWLKAGTAFSTVFSGATGTAGTQGIYQETATGGTPTITQVSTTSYSSGFIYPTVPGEFAQNTNASSGLLLNGWESTYINYSNTSSHQINNGSSGAQGAVNGPQSNVNPGANGTGLNFQYVTGVTGGNLSTGTLTAFNLNSMQIDSSATAVGFTIEGLRNGVVVDTADVSYNFYNGYVTFSPTGWTDIDTVVFTDVNLGNNVFAIQNINIDPYTAPVPEPATLLLLGSGFVGLAAFRRKFGKA